MLKIRRCLKCLKGKRRYLRISTINNIVRLEAHLTDKNYHYFIFELCKGGDLYSLIKDQDYLNVDLIRHYSIELVHALEVLQQKHIVHRDIKPANILLDNSFHIILADFGLARWIDEEDIYEVLKKKSFDTEWYYFEF